MISAMTFQDLFGVNRVQRIVSNLMKVGAPISSYYKVGYGSRPTDKSEVRTFYYDVFDNVRETAGFTNPYSGSRTINRRPFTQRSATAVFQSNKYIFYKDEFLRHRVPGQGPDRIDQDGKVRQAMELAALTQLHANSMDWAFRSMLMGKLQFDYRGDQMVVVNKASTADVEVAYERDSALTGQLPLGPSAANLITGSFDDPNTDIPAIIRSIRAIGPKVFQGDYTEWWINTPTLNAMMSNRYIQEQGGTAFKAFESIVPQGLQGGAPAIPGLPTMPQRGFETVIFRALGSTYRFNVIDHGLMVDDGTGSLVYTPFVPTGKMFVTPAPVPGTWYGRTDVMTLSQQYDHTPMKKNYGMFTMVRDRAQNTPHFEVEMSNHFFFPLLMPNVHLVADVFFT